MLTYHHPYVDLPLALTIRSQGKGYMLDLATIRNHVCALEYCSGEYPDAILLIDRELLDSHFERFGQVRDVLASAMVFSYIIV